MHACMYFDDEPINTKEDDMQEKLKLHDGRHVFAVGKPTTHNMHACMHVQESQIVLVSLVISSPTVRAFP